MNTSLKKIILRFITTFLVLFLSFAGLTACKKDNHEPENPTTSSVTVVETTEGDSHKQTEKQEHTHKQTEEDTAPDIFSDISEDGEYTSKDEVAAYIYLYGKLPKNYITKSEAEDLGWVSSKGNLNKVAPGKSIGGDKFGNREGLLPTAKGRKYYECDIDYVSGTRNAKRIIFSNDGLIYYTDDHYNSFELLYGDE